MPSEWWRDKSVMGQLGQVRPMTENMPETSLRNKQGVGPVSGTVEEGEYVMDKPIVDKIGPEALDGLRTKIRSGTITKDQINSISGGGGAQSYKRGGMVKSYKTGGLVKKYQDGGFVNPLGYLTDPFSGETEQSTTTQKPQIPQKATIPQKTPDINQTESTSSVDSFAPTGIGLPVINQPVTPPTVSGVPSAPTDATGVTPFTGDLEPPETAGVVDTIPPKVPKGIPSTEKRARGIGMGGLEQIAAGEHPLFRTLANMAQQQVAAQGAMDTAALRQQMAQMGVTGGAANALLADIQRDIGSQMVQTAAQTAIESQKLSTEAIKSLASEGLLGMKEERIAKGEQYGVLMNQYDEALRSGQFDQAEQIWNNIMGQFPEYSTGVKPDFAKLSNTYNREQIDGINSTLGKLIKTGSSFEEVRGYLVDKLETESGMTIEELAAQKGMPEDDLLQDVYDRIEAFGADDITRMLSIYKDAYKDIVDTPEEEEALSRWVSDMYLNKGLVINAEGNLTTKPESALLPWNAPSTAHLFDQSYSLSPDQVATDMGVPVDDPSVQAEVDRRTGIRDMRTSYVDSMDTGQTPIAWDEWETGYNDALQELISQPNYDTMSDQEKDDFISGRMDELTAGVETFETDIGGVPIIQEDGAPGEGVLETAGTIGGTDYPAGTPIKYDSAGEPYVYTYSQAKSDAGGNATDVSLDDIKYYTGLGDTSAARDFLTLAKSNLPMILRQMQPGDTSYNTLLGVAPNGSIDYISKADSYDKVVNRDGTLYIVKDTVEETDPDRTVTYLIDVATGVAKKLSHYSQDFVS